MERIRIPNQATYSPIALTDLLMAAPIVSRVLLGATGPGAVVQVVALGAYAGSAITDWLSRLDARKIDFLEVFGADVRRHKPMPRAERERDIQRLIGEVNLAFQPMTLSRMEVARRVDLALTGYIAGITGQRVETSRRVRDASLVGLFLPFALGACDILTGDITVLKETGIFEPHVLAHEFSHRKGYFKELEAQALSYLSLMESGDPLLVQSARCERLHRQWRVLAEGDIEHFHDLVDASHLRPELKAEFERLRPIPSALEKSITELLKPLYEERMKVTGQNGLSDYDEGFTNFLYTMELERETEAAE